MHTSSNEPASQLTFESNDIERLFPKCPLKQASLIGGQPKEASTVSRRQRRMKVHQYSRRELEARRSKNRLSGATDARGQANESSDDNGAGGSYSSRNRRFGKRGRLALTSSVDISAPQQSTSIQQQPGVPLSTRRPSKYMASKNLLQQLSRSQSTYNNNGATSKAAVLDGEPVKSQPKGRGIVKSSQSFTFPDELAIETTQPRSRYPQPGVATQFCDASTKPTDNSCSDLVVGGTASDRGSARSIIKRQSSSIREASNKDAANNSIKEGQGDDFSMDQLLSKLDRRRHSLIQKDSPLFNEHSQNGRGSLACLDLTATQVLCQPLVDLTPSSQPITAEQKPSGAEFAVNNESSSIIPEPSAIRLDLTHSANGKQQELQQDQQEDKYINILVYDNVNQQPHQALGSREERQSSHSITDSSHRLVHHSLKAKSVTRFQPRVTSNRPQQRHTKSTDESRDEDLLIESKVLDFNLASSFDESTIFTEPPKPLSPKEASSTLHSSDPADHLPSRASREADFNAEIVTIYHEASRQLLATAPDAGGRDEELNLTREDASVEELCNPCNQFEAELYSSNACTQPTDQTSLESEGNSKQQSIGEEGDKEKNIISETTTTTSQDKFLVEGKELGTIEDDDEGTELVDKTDVDRTGSAMYTLKKACVPPGYPQRITPPVSNDEVESPKQPQLTLNLTQQKHSKQLKSNLVQLDNSTGVTTTHDSKNLKTEVQRVKFDEKNLVSVLDERDEYHGETSRDKSGRRQLEHTPTSQQPSAREALYDFDTKTLDSEPIEGVLSAGMNRMSLSDSLAHQALLNNSPIADVLHNKNKLLEAGEVQHQHPATSSTSHPLLDISSNESLNDIRKPPLKPLGELYSTAKRLIEPSSLVKSSSVQFTVLSDAESGMEEISNSHQTSQTSQRLSEKKCDSYLLALDSGQQYRGTPGTATSAAKLIDNGLMGPITKTALIFPRLDEGLSSEAESYGGDDAEEDDERAMEADVDADDDEDEDEDDDEDDDDDNINDDDEDDDEDMLDNQQVVQSYDRRNMAMGSNLVTKQPKTRSSNRLMNSQQQQQQTPSVLSNLSSEQQSDLNHFKSELAGSSFGCYINQDSLEQTGDIRSVNNPYSSNHNGSYTVGLSNQPGPLDGSSGSSNQQHQFQNHQQQQRNHNETGNLFKQQQHLRYNRDEGKVANRISSDTDNETDRLLGNQRIEQQLKQQQQQQASSVEGNGNSSVALPVPTSMKPESNFKEVLYEGVVFIVKYLGSTHSDCEGRSEKEDRIHQAEMAVHEVKLRDCESRSAIEVQLFISTEKIMVLDDKHSKVLMDHSLRTISYIADIGDAIVLIVRKKSNLTESANEFGRPVSKISCHVFESSQSHTITKSISQAFQVAYTELLKANGSSDVSGYLPKETDYQEVLNSQEMSTDELEMFARKDNQREVIVPKEKGEILGLSIVESGWGSVLPTVVIANLKYGGPAYRCKKLSIGDQILSINGVSLVGLPLADCQEILRRTKKQRVARLSVVPCPITVEVKIKRPDTKYQLGFSVQNGVICSLLRGGIAERGGVRVGHRIMSINGTTVVNVPHEKIVSLLASSVGEIKMKTCLTSLYRQILGEENPVHF